MIMEIKKPYVIHFTEFSGMSFMSLIEWFGRLKYHEKSLG